MAEKKEAHHGKQPNQKMKPFIVMNYLEKLDSNISNFTICILYDGNNGLCVAEYALQLVQSCLKDVRKK